MEEIGYTDALLDVRSSRVRSLLGIHTDKDDHHLKPESGSESSSQQPTQSLSANSAAAGYCINVLYASPASPEAYEPMWSPKSSLKWFSIKLFWEGNLSLQ